MAGLMILKHIARSLDEVLCDRWVENRISSISAARILSAPAGFDRSSLTRWRQRMGERSPDPAPESLAWRPRARRLKAGRALAGDRRYHGAAKAVAFPTEAKLLHRDANAWCGCSQAWPEVAAIL